jgi:signal transduction histidine kinase
MLRRVTGLETRMPVYFEECQPLTMQGDVDQLEQVLINLIRNAVDAAQTTGGRVFVRHEQLPGIVIISIRDEGPGLSNTANLFVPFFTTKRGGSGIGLVLSRQIAEAHNGTLTLRNANDGARVHCGAYAAAARLELIATNHGFQFAQYSLTADHSGHAERRCRPKMAFDTWLRRFGSLRLRAIVAIR